VLANVAENLNCDVAAEAPLPHASLSTRSDSSPQSMLTEQCFSFWPTLRQKLSYMTSDDRTLVWRALCVACASASTARKAQFRPLEQFQQVALILAELKLGVATVAAGLLHNVLAETELTEDDLTTLFSDEVSTIVAGCTKVSKLRMPRMPRHALTDAEQAENLREMLLAMADDSRVILLKCAVRLYEMRTLNYPEQSTWTKRTALAQETLDIFVPLAGKSGIYAIKAELADLAFQHLHPTEHRMLSGSVERYAAESDAELGDALKWLTDRIRSDELLKAHNVTVSISGRVKNLYSIWQKMQDLSAQKMEEEMQDEYETKRAGDCLDEINDIYAARMLIDYPQQAWESEEEYRERGIALCYHVFGLLEIKLWTDYLASPSVDGIAPTWMVGGEFKDYIAVPKPNGYQSLHTVVVRNLPVEVQVRTRWMHVNAEYGIASHWLYKDEKAGLTKLRSYKLAFLDPLHRMDSEIVDSQTFMDSVRKELLGKRTFVYLPDNRILNLPRGATALDAAFKIHTDIGICMKRAYVNGESVDAATELQNGDRIFIETAEEPLAEEAWLADAWTRSCRAKLRQYLRMQDQTNELRAHLMEKELRDGEDLPLAMKLTDENKIGHESSEKKSSTVRYEIVSDSSKGQFRRTNVAGRKARNADEPEYALV
jgi:GTP pyrophosphokinase